MHLKLSSGPSKSKKEINRIKWEVQTQHRKWSDCNTRPQTRPVLLFLLQNNNLSSINIYVIYVYVLCKKSCRFKKKVLYS